MRKPGRANLWFAPAKQSFAVPSYATHLRLGTLARAPAAFTLVEMLVVTAVVAVLISILLPALHTARAQARQVSCAARLQQWGVAFACYAAENRGMWPHCDGLDRGPREMHDPHVTKEDVADWHGWVDVLPPLIASKPWREHPRYGYPAVGTFYQCPEGRPVGGAVYNYRPDRDGYFSFAMNSCLELDRNAWPPADGVGFPMPSFLDTAKIVWPSQVVVLFDQLMDPQKGFDGDQTYFGAGKHCGSYPKSFSARHRRGGGKLGGDLLFGDGHVEWRGSVWKPEWDADLEVPPRDDRNWYPYPVWEDS